MLNNKNSQNTFCDETFSEVSADGLSAVREDRASTSQLRGAPEVGSTSVNFGVITDAVSESVVAPIKPSSGLTGDVVGNPHVSSLGNRVSRVTIANAATTMNDLIKLTSVFANTISKFRAFRAKVSVKVVPRFSPFAVGMTRVGYHSIYATPQSMDLVTQSDLVTCRFCDVNFACAEGATIDCSSLTNRVWFSNPNYATLDDAYPGSFHIKNLYLDDVIGGGSLQYYVTFENLEVVYPLPNIVVAQIADESTTSDCNAVSAIRSKYRQRPTTFNLPKRTSDDMLFDNMSVQAPFYYPLGTFSVPTSQLLSIRDHVSFSYSLVGSTDTILYDHPIKVLMANASKLRFDVHVKLVCVKNAFQNGVFTINYGRGVIDGSGSLVVPDASTTGNLTYIEWNIAAQDSIEFDIPWARIHNWGTFSSDDRFLSIANAAPIIPTMTGSGDTVFIYALITYKNLEVFEWADEVVAPTVRTVRVQSDAVEAQIGDVSSSESAGAFRSLRVFMSRPIVGTVDVTTEGGIVRVLRAFVNIGGFVSEYLQGVVFTSTSSKRREGAPSITQGAYEIYPRQNWFDTHDGITPDSGIDTIGAVSLFRELGTIGSAGTTARVTGLEGLVFSDFSLFVPSITVTLQGKEPTPNPVMQPPPSLKRVQAPTLDQLLLDEVYQHRVPSGAGSVIPSVGQTFDSTNSIVKVDL